MIKVIQTKTKLEITHNWVAKKFYNKKSFKKKKIVLTVFQKWWDFIRPHSDGVPDLFETPKCYHHHFVLNI